MYTICCALMPVKRERNDFVLDNKNTVPNFIFQIELTFSGVY